MVEKNEFQWTDELVSEYTELFLQETFRVMAATPQGAEEKKRTTPEQFIASKHSIELEWKVVAVSDKYGDHKIFELDEATDKIDGQSYNYVVTVRVGNRFNIHAVRRIGDGEVFTVGENITSNNPDEVYKITGFTERDPIMTADHSMGYINIMFAQKAKPVLFRTQDSVDIFEGDTFWYTNSHVWQTYSSIATKRNVEVLMEINKYVPFSTEELALDWHRDNKPSYSFKQIMEAMDKVGFTKATILAFRDQLLNQQQL